MDPAHGPFVHQAWWWRKRESIHEKQKHFEPIPNGFRMSAHTPSSNSAPYKLLRMYADADSITTTIDFVLPNLRLESIRAGKYWFSFFDHGHAHHPQSLPHRRSRLLESVPRHPLRPIDIEVRVCKIRRARPAHHGAASRGPETESTPHVDRRRRPSRQMVLRTKSRSSRGQADRRRIETPNERARHAEMAKLEQRS